MDVFIPAFLLLGAAVGFFAGLLGVGGGGLMVPILTALFVSQVFPSEHLLHLALGTSMAAIVPTSLASLWAHQKKGAVVWPIVKQITPSILVGTFASTFMASFLSTRALAVFFAAFMAFIAVQMWLGVKPKPQRSVPSMGGLSVVGSVIGSISALVAIGGGSLTVPFLMWCNVPIRQAIATSAAIGLPIALAGAMGYVINGWGVAGLPAYSVGFVYVPAVVLIASVSFFTTRLGANLAHSLPVDILKKVFAVLLVVLSAKMLHSIVI